MVVLVSSKGGGLAGWAREVQYRKYDQSKAGDPDFRSTSFSLSLNNTNVCNSSFTAHKPTCAMIFWALVQVQKIQEFV